MESDRKLATIRRISAINKIPKADAIEVATVDGWNVVVKKGEFNVGDLAVYFEIDSWIPTAIASFLSKGKTPREFNGVSGERLRTVKLRGQLSQGLLLPLEPTCENIESQLIEGLDVSLPLNIQKWERPLPAQLAGQVRGNFPSFIPKTNEERIQNLASLIESFADDEWEITEKLDGSSMTVYWNNGTYGVCSRNLELKPEDEENAFVKTAIDYNIPDSLASLNQNIAIQGELVGPGIQGNPYDLSRTMYFVYKIWDIDKQEYLDGRSRRALTSQLKLNHVPVHATVASLKGMSLQDILNKADGESTLNAKAKREGLVFKSNTRSFKAISNLWLLDGND